jgi:hypothetical protein
MRAKLDPEGVCLGRDRFEFKDLKDAAINNGTLLLVTANGARWEGRVRDGFAILDKILTGIGLAHRVAAVTYREPAAPSRKREPHRGAPRIHKHWARGEHHDLWIGRTLYH